jgi:hypothetical protein
MCVIGKPEEKRERASLKSIWKGNMQMKMALKGVDWRNMYEYRDRWRAVVNRLMNFLVP